MSTLHTITELNDEYDDQHSIELCVETGSDIMIMVPDLERPHVHQCRVAVEIWNGELRVIVHDDESEEPVTIVPIRDLDKRIAS